MAPITTGERVGRSDTNRFVTPVNQVLTPAGRQVELPRMRPQGIALSPDGKWLVTSGKTSELVVVDPDTGNILQRVSLPSERLNEPQADVVSSHWQQPDKDGQLSFTGLVFSPDGSHIYLANVNGSV
jgi:DNA-binding beta-propeller fold protein YncE